MEITQQEIKEVKVWTHFPTRDETPDCIFVVRFRSDLVPEWDMNERLWYVFERSGRSKGAVEIAKIRNARLAKTFALMAGDVSGRRVSLKEKTS